MRRAFTLIELLVVVAMIAVLSGAVGAGVNAARKRALITKARAEAQEITNAILGFQQYARGRSLVPYATGGWKDATEGALKMILGGETSESGDPVPVLYNAQLTGGKILDPWGHAYKFQIKQLSGESEVGSSVQYLRAANLPNFHRLTDEERQ